MNRVILIVLFLSPFLLFLDTIYSFFSQDDFFHLRVVMDKSFNNIPSFFLSLQKEYAFYRPLSRETFNLLMYRSFGLNPLPFHLANLSLIIINTGLIFLLTKKLTKNLTTSLIAVLFFSLNSIHSIEIYYLASVQTLMATFFLLLSILFYISSSKLRNYFLSFVFFIFGLLSHEIAIVLIGILFFLELSIINKRIWNINIFMRLLPFITVGLFYLINTSLFNRLPQEQVYQPVLSIKSIMNTLSWYTLWTAGVPEFVIDFIGPKLTVNPNLVKWYGSFLTVFLPAFLFGTCALIYIILRFRNKLIKDKVVWFTLIAYLISLSPFLLFPQHKSSYYLTLASGWFSILAALLLSRVWEKQKYLVILIMLAFLTVFYQTTTINKITYWAAKRSNAAHSLLSDVKQKYPTVDNGAIFYIVRDPGYPFIAREWGSSSKQAFYILSGSDAFKLIYQDLSLQVYFQDVNDLPENVNPAKVMKFTAKFPY